MKKQESAYYLQISPWFGKYFFSLNLYLGRYMGEQQCHLSGQLPLNTQHEHEAVPLGTSECVLLDPQVSPKLLQTEQC